MQRRRRILKLPFKVKMLKEQDALIGFILEWILHPIDGRTLSVLEVFESIEQMITEYVKSDGAPCRLTKYVPQSPKFFLSLPLVKAIQEYNINTHLLSRRYVAPSFKEIRHVLNLAVVDSIASHVKLITFDADDTIYEDGGSIM